MRRCLGHMNTTAVPVIYGGLDAQSEGCMNPAVTRQKDAKGSTNEMIREVNVIFYIPRTVRTGTIKPCPRKPLPLPQLAR